MPALFGLASGMFINILFISSKYPSLASVNSTTDKWAHRITGMFESFIYFQVPSNGLLLLLRYRPHTNTTSQITEGIPQKMAQIISQRLG